MITKLNLHDLYVQKLALSIESKYDDISLHVEIRSGKCALGEIDILARVGDEVHLYEVKCSYRIIKARKQLSRIKRLLQVEQAQLFFYHGDSDTVVNVEPVATHKSERKRPVTLVAH